MQQIQIIVVVKLLTT